jgi:hypothetical protein
MQRTRWPLSGYVIGAGVVLPNTTTPSCVLCIGVGFGPLLHYDERLLRRDCSHCASAGQLALTATTRRTAALPNFPLSRRSGLPHIGVPQHVGERALRHFQPAHSVDARPSNGTPTAGGSERSAGMQDLGTDLDGQVVDLGLGAESPPDRDNGFDDLLSDRTCAYFPDGHPLERRRVIRLRDVVPIR